MNIGQIALKYKTAFLFVLCILIALSIATFFKLPEDVFPNATFPRILLQIDRGYAPLEEMEVAVVKPIEDAMRTVEGVRLVRSKTNRGFSEINLFFEWNIDRMQAFQLTQAKLSEVRGSLPHDTKITLRRMTTSAYAMSGYSLYSDNKTLKELTDIAEFVIKPQLAGIKGVYNIEIVGGRVPEYWVELDPDKLVSYNINPLEVNTALMKTNIVDFSGRITEEYKIHLGFIDNLLHNAEDIGNVSVTERNGIPVRIKDVAKVHDAVREEYIITTSNWHKSVLLNILKHPDANGIEVSDLVDRKLQELQSRIPADVEVSKWYDLNDFVRRSLRGVGENLLLGIVVVSFFVLLFVKSLRATISIIFIMPLSVILTFFAMRFFNFSLNIMTLGGLVASIGILIDNAVVVVENIIRHKSIEDKGDNSIISATSEIVNPMIGATVTTVIVFVPFAFLSEITGVFFKPMAFVLGITLIISLFLALFVTPGIASILFRRRSGFSKEGFLIRGLKKVYELVLRFILKQWWIAGLLVILLIAASIHIFPKLKTGFMPEWDEGTIVIDYKALPGTSLEETDRLMWKIENIMQDIPDIQAYSRRTGFGLAHPHPAHEGDYLITLKEDRELSTFEIMHYLETEIKRKNPTLDIELFQVLPDRLGDLTGKQKPLVVKIFGNKYTEMLSLAEDIKTELQNISGLHGVRLGVSESEPEFTIVTDRFNAARYHLSPELVSQHAKIFFWGNVATRIKKGLRLVGVRLRYPPEYRENIEDIGDFLIYSPNTGFIPLKMVADVSVQSSPSEISHENGSLMVPIFANFEGRDLGSIVSDVNLSLNSMNLPPGITLSIAGDYESRIKSFRELFYVTLVAIIFIFTILLFEFKSLRTSLAILIGTLVAFSFVFFGLWFTGTPFDVSSFVGMITILGIIINNGILLIDFTERNIKQGKSTLEALVSAGKVRLRPIFITNLTTFAGLLPLALGIGTGGEILQPFAVAVISGLVGSMMFSLVIIPAFYNLFHRNVKIS